VCGRYTLYGHEDDLASLFEVKTYPLTERFNIAPTQSVPVVRQQAGGKREMSAMRWGLVPHWVKDPAEFKANLFNARSESAADKPSFREAVRRGRCIIPASGFYEWQKVEDGKQPHYICRADAKPLAFAGLWSANVRGNEPMLSCTILTTSANPDIIELHDRMPVILERDSWSRWLDPDELDPQRLEDLLVPAEEGVLTMHLVGREVRNSRIDRRELIEPLNG